MILLATIKSKAAALKREVYVLYLAARDPRTPCYAKTWIGSVIAYALTPIDLIPDPIPILGYLDDMILLPLGNYLAIKLIPQPILANCRKKAELHYEHPPKNWLAGEIIVAL